MIRPAKPVFPRDGVEPRSDKTNGERSRHVSDQGRVLAARRPPRISYILDGIAHTRDSELPCDPADRAHHARMDVRVLVRVHVSQLNPGAADFFELRT